MNKRGVTPIHLAANNNRIDVVEQLVDAGASTTRSCTDYGTPLMAAAMSRSFRVVEYLLRKGADANAVCADFVFRTALQAAASQRRRNGSTIRALINGHADVNLTGGYYGSALCAAVVNNKQTVEQLLKTE
ncbi:ankyrin, partial [Lophiostoma macrostomum CBS 122681]